MERLSQTHLQACPNQIVTDLSHDLAQTWLWRQVPDKIGM